MLRAQTPIAKLTFDKSTLTLQIELTKDAVANPDTVRAHAETIQKITGGQKHSVLIDASNNYTRLDNLEDELLLLTYKNRIASAYFAPTLAIRLRIIQIKKKSNSHKIEVFSSKPEAIQWLQKMNNPHIVPGV